MRCKICGDVVRVGHAVHNSCFERLLAVWHPETDTPMTHVEYIETDEGQEPYKEKLENSGKLLVAAFEQAKAELQKYKHAAFMIGEICVDESKSHISPEDAIKKIRGQLYYGGHRCELPPHGDLIDLSAKVDCQYYDEMYEEWSVRTVTVEDVLRGCLEKMPPVIVPASEEVADENP